MNIYFCYHKNHDCGCYIAADTIGKAKALYAKWDGMENFTEYRGHVMCKDVEVPVVRCGKCKHFRPYEGEEHKGDCAELVGLESCVYEDDFCSYGERKEGAE